MTQPRTTVAVDLADRTYPIEIDAGWLGDIGPRVKTLLRSGSVLILTDSNVGPLYGELVAGSLRRAGIRTAMCIVAAGEASKSQDVLSMVYDALVREQIPRQGALVALGGGVVGDLGGYAAATYLRGIDFVQVPTSLLAMVDSSVGGKTGINHPQGKNLIGAFWQPRIVFVDTDLLKTLPRRELVSGMAEVIKHGVIRDADYFALVEQRIDSILAVDGESMGRVVEGSCRIKSAVVASDEREVTGLRAFLNFGHTIGHALEAVTGYGTLSHGEAVAIGMVAAGRIATRRTAWTAADQERLERLLMRTGLPTRIPRGIDLEALMGTMKLDKKVKDGRVRFVLPTRIGSVELVDDVAESDVRTVSEQLQSR